MLLADLAQRTLDVQYFIWESDATGRILVDRLLRAADRGVRVRVLVDDANLKEHRDAPIAALDAHPNVEIRLFNPFAHRGSRLLGFATDFDRVNHRMHNKLMVMDNALAIVGGRNMSDPYFEVDDKANFRDLDIAAVGPVVRDLSKVFDRFWNGEWSVPIAALVDRRYDESDLRAHAQRMRAAIAKGGYPHPLDQDVAALASELATILRALVWAPGHVVFDDPASINDPSLRVMHKLLLQRFDRLQTELLIESAYFIPLDGGVAKLKELVERGVRVRILTNSLASNDVISAFAGYSNSREALIRSGVELHELRPNQGRRASGSSAWAANRGCTPRPSCSTARTCSSAASTSMRVRAPSTPKPGSTWRARRSPRRWSNTWTKARIPKSATGCSWTGTGSCLDRRGRGDAAAPRHRSGDDALAAIPRWPDPHAARRIPAVDAVSGAAARRSARRRLARSEEPRARSFVMAARTHRLSRLQPPFVNAACLPTSSNRTGSRRPKS